MGVTSAQPSPSNVATQLSNGDLLGTVLGFGPTDLIAFYGGANNNALTPNAVAGVTQPTSPAQAALNAAQQAGVVTTWSTTQSPTAVTPNTTVESSMTVQSGTVTNAPNLIATTDLIYINKPTAQAGLGMGNAYASASNTVKVNFSNLTAATVTPTASQVYAIVSLRGIPAITATLTPAAVGPNTTIEQQFPVTAPVNGYGLTPGQLVQVTKPTNQAGLDIVGCRTVSANTIGITFANFTAATITPTAGESYTAWCLPGLDCLNNYVGFQFNAGTIGAIAAGFQPTGGNTAVTGVLATDIAIGAASSGSVVPAATGTNSAFPAFSLLAANAITMEFCGIGTGATPTAALPYNQVIFRQNPVAPLVNYIQTLTPVSVAANTSAEQTFTVTGLVSGTPAWVNKPSWQAGLGIAGVRVSATNTLAITYINTTATAMTPAAEAYTIGNFQVPTPGAGNAVYQTVAMNDIAQNNLGISLRTAAVSLGLVKGS